MKRRPVLFNVAISVILLPIAAALALFELATVERANCNRDTFESICSDYEGSYGVASAVFLLLWAMLTWLVNRGRKAEPDVP